MSAWAARGGKKVEAGKKDVQPVDALEVLEAARAHNPVKASRYRR